MTDETPEEIKQRIRSARAAAARSVGISIIAGLVAGAVGGLGSRVAMRVVAVAAGPLARGQLTENENPVGVITAGGTIALVVFGALFFGIPGGLLYASWRETLTRFDRAGWIFGIGSLLVFGGTVITFENPDFRRFATPGLDVLVFAAVFPLFGLVMARTDEALRRRVEAVPRESDAYKVLWVPIVLALAVGVLFVLSTVGRLGAGNDAPPDPSGFALALVFLYAIIGAPFLRRILPRTDWAETVVTAPLLVGVVVTMRAVVRIVSV